MIELTKSVARVLALLSVSFLALATLPQAQASVVKVGGVCKPVGAKATASGKALICTKVGNKLIWKQAKAGPVLLIGSPLPLSGPAGVYGQAFSKVMQLAIREANAEGGVNGRQIKLIIVDDASDPAQGVAAVKRLLEQQKVSLFFGGSYTPSTLAEAQAVTSAGKVFFVLSSSPLLTSSFNKYIFQPNVTFEEEAVGIATLVNSLKQKKIGFIAENDSLGQGTLAAAQIQLGKFGLTVSTVAKIDPSATSALAQVDQLRAAGARKGQPS